MNERLKHYNEKMEKTIRVLENEYSAIRAGRANPAVLDKITVDYYGTPTQIQAMAAISVSEASFTGLNSRIGTLDFSR